MATDTVALNPAEQVEELRRRKGLTPVQIALSKARAMAWALEELGDEHNNLRHAVRGLGVPKETREWLHSIVAEALRGALDEAEAAFLKATEKKAVA